ncbi:MAG: hypothetical protein HY701_10555, partial [Gemmatimonadetes bacterium]|nr:hypothetical protein [Gemmatimonadota bacterium]
VMAATAIGLCSCYKYVPIALDSVPLGNDVRVYVTRDGMSELRGVLEEDVPVSGLPVVSGRLLGRDDAGLAVRIPVFSQQVGFLQTQIGQQVTVPLSEVIQIERRQLDGLRTGLLVAGGAAASALVILQILGESRRPEEPPQYPDQDTRLPLLFVPFP